MGHGRYRLVRRIGVGGMAEVFEAVMRGDAGFERRVAIKRLRGGDTDPAFERMFLDEARIASRLSHANVVSVIDYGVLDDRPFQVLELVDGIDASQLVARLAELGRAIPTEIAVHIGVEIGHALHCAHEAVDGDGEPLGIVHRDVSPHNVLLSWAGDVKLSDFGIAFARDRSERTQGGVAKGKLAYMAPEQALGGRVDARTDVFGLGCVLHALLAGASPLAEPDALSGFLAGDPLPIAGSIPDDLRAIVERATARARHERFATAREMTEALGVSRARRSDRDPRTMLADLLAEIRAPASERDETFQAIELVVAGDTPNTHGTVLRSRAPRRDRRVGLAVALGAALVVGGVIAAVTVARSARGDDRVVVVVDSPPALAIGASADAAVAVEVAVEVVDASGEIAIDAAIASRRHRARRPPPPPAVTTRGHLKIVGGEVNHARVFIDRAMRGRAPTTAIDVASGRHALVLELTDGTSIGPFEIVVDERSTAATPRVVRCTRTSCR